MADLTNEVFFFGEYEHNLDSQGRLTIPSEWRQQQDTRLILLPGRANDLLLFPFATFREFLIKAGKLSLANKELQAALARIGAKARDCHCDKQGRIKIDKAMLQSINVTTTLKVIGAITHIKLCSVDTWNNMPDEGDDTYLDELQKISDNLADLNI
ncbi:MAG: hypothetical protein IJW31_00670 [Lentisphaeria bacterium]|nr:hypothetical protein [Lentisphaeria bacterium]